MGMTLAERILAAHAGLERVSPGQLIRVRVDLVLANDITAPIAIREFERIGVEEVLDRSKLGGRTPQEIAHAVHSVGKLAEGMDQTAGLGGTRKLLQLRIVAVEDLLGGARAPLDRPNVMQPGEQDVGRGHADEQVEGEPRVRR